MGVLEILNLIIFAIQTVILVVQIRINFKFSKQNISREKGYFIIEESNYITVEEYQKRFINKFELGSGKALGFYVAGKADVIVCHSELIVDGITQYSDYYPLETLFTLDPRNNILKIQLDLNDNQLDKDSLDFELKLDLKNCIGYKYTEIICMKFTKDQETNSRFWTLSNFNIYFR